MTRAEYMRKMNDDELAKFLCDNTGPCWGCCARQLCSYEEEVSNGYKKWLKQEATEQGNKEGKQDD